MINYKDLMSQIQDYISQVKASDTEMEEYKSDFYNMSVGSLKAIAAHAEAIIKALDNANVKENLTESWLQGKIAITEDYMRTIHDFIMFVSETDDNEKGISKTDRPGLWENIRKKREREGKKYRPAKPGDKDRPNPDQWKRLTQSKICAKCGQTFGTCGCVQ